MAEVFFYHLEGVSPGNVLPELLRRGLQRNLRMSIQLIDQDQVSDLSTQLWGEAETAFLPHGFGGEPFPEQQHIWLSCDADNPNKSTFRFFAGGAMPDDLTGYARSSLLFDGTDEAQLDAARQLWRRAKVDGFDVKYWKKDGAGRWVDMAAQRGEA